MAVLLMIFMSLLVATSGDWVAGDPRERACSDSLNCVLVCSFKLEKRKQFNAELYLQAPHPRQN